MNILKRLEEVKLVELSSTSVEGGAWRVKCLIDVYAECCAAFAPEDNGNVIVVEGGTEHEVAAQAGYSLTEATFEGGFHKRRSFPSARCTTTSLASVAYFARLLMQ